MRVLIETTDLQKYRWIDARFDLADPAKGRKQYEEEHVKGAVHWDLERDLSDMASENGRHPMPSKEQLVDLINTSGLSKTDSVVIYDQGGAPFAARAWWTLKYAGFDNVFISKKGFKDLKTEGIEITDEIPEFLPAQESLSFNESMYADRNYVKAIIDGKELGVLLDARSPERFAGTKEPIDPVAGRIPGARNFDWSQLVSNGKFKESTDFSGVIQTSEPAVVYCGSGVTAAALYAMLHAEGHDHLRLYMGSYSDWITDEGNEVEIDRGEHPEAADDETRIILAKLIEEGYSGEMLMKKFEYEKSLLDKK